MSDPQPELRDPQLLLQRMYTLPLDAWQPQLATLSRILSRQSRTWRQRMAAYEQPPAPPAEFVTSPLYLGLGPRVYPAVLDTLEEIFTGGYNEAALCWGIGAGKSFFSSLAISYLVHRTLCLRDPQGYYGLAPGSTIAFLNMSASAGQAQRVVFNEIKQRLTASPWFRRFCARYGKDGLQVLSGEIRLPKQLVVVTGNSAETCPLGYNLLGAVLDEAAFLLSTGDGRHDAAEEIYHALRQRITSRFFGRGLLVLISSPRHVGDFIERKLAEGNAEPAEGSAAARAGWGPSRAVRREPPMRPFQGGDGRPSGGGTRLYTSRRAIWEVKPPELYCGRVFEYQGLQIPVEYQDDFRRNPQRALRDLAARPTQAYCAWFTDEAALEACCCDRVAQASQPASGDSGQAGQPTLPPEDHPLDTAGRWRPDLRAPDRLPRYVHVDLGLRRDGCGIAMVHCRPCPDRPEEPEVWADLVVRITASPSPARERGLGGEASLPPPAPGGGQGGGLSLATRDSRLATSEVDFARVRELLTDLRRRGYNLAQVSFDGWQSVDSRQILRRQGLRTALVSVDRDLAAYETLKELVNTGRLHFPRYEPLLRELKRLELVDGRKVDHPRGGSKDVADALAAAVSEAVKHWGGGKVGGRVV